MTPIERERQEFEDPSEWWTSTKGNRTRRWDGGLVVVYRSRRLPGRYQYCIVDPSGSPRYSRDTFPTEKATIRALVEVLGLLPDPVPDPPYPIPLRRRVSPPGPDGVGCMATGVGDGSG